ncbi:hypothetical protein BGZ96_009176 [Linnemannia gamsii]|uniref:HCP-like protein n=1 Tax=Linnemannia gamsii TaxID=64522 RepID=A0ABQ7JXB4_9FUNG|nr:hypothetical protein BGZ96_009176 [Linnemannia gamsii]
MPQYQYHGQQQQQYPSMRQQQQHYQQYQQSFQPAQQPYHHQQQPPQQQQFQQQQFQQQQQYNQKQEFHQKEEYQEVSERKSTDSGVTTASLPLTTATMTITANGDQTHSVAFSDSQIRQVGQQQQQQQHLAPLQPPQQQQQQQQQSDNSTAQKRKSQVPAAAPKVLTPAQQREEETDANIQKAIELHENNQLEEATHYFRLAAQSDNPVGQLMYGLSLRHGWGCEPNPKDAIFYLQRAAEYAMGELKELSLGSSANIRAIQSHPSMRGYAARAEQRQQQQPLKRMGTLDRKSAMLTARKELVMPLYELGMSFLKGWGVAKDKVIAFHYFKLAADLGDPESQNETAQCFLEGVGVEKNAFEAARYYRLASDQGASQLGNSWIWKPKYDQYCEQHAAVTAAESATRKAALQNGGSGASLPVPPIVPPPITTGGLMPTNGGGFSSSLASVKKHLHRKSFGATPTPPTGGGPATAPLGGSGASSTTTAGGMDKAEAARKGRYNLAGDLISSSQLELRIKQAEQLTNATVKPILSADANGGQQGQGDGKKKHHRWSIWHATSRHHRTSSD